MATSRCANGYLPIEDYAIIGDMNTCALVGKDASLDFLCWPAFDDPSVFCRLLDSNSGGHFSLDPSNQIVPKPIVKQQYLPSSNVLQTRWIHESGVVTLTDFFFIDGQSRASTHPTNVPRCLVRRLDCVRGQMVMNVDLSPSFDYGLTEHEINFLDVENAYGDQTCQSLRLRSPKLTLQLDIYGQSDGTRGGFPDARFFLRTGSRGEACAGRLSLQEGQSIQFILHEPKDVLGPVLRPNNAALHDLGHITLAFWRDWISKSNYRGRYREQVERSLLILKLLQYEPTGAIIASPTFSLPEDVGGTRNWDYRYSWVRDSSFVVYVFLKFGFIDEGEGYITFIMSRLQNRRADDALPIMFNIHGGVDLTEIELTHLSGYKGSKPVRIGNGAADHVQLDGM